VLETGEQETALHRYEVSPAQNEATQKGFFSAFFFLLVWTFPACLCKAGMLQQRGAHNMLSRQVSRMDLPWASLV